MIGVPPMSNTNNENVPEINFFISTGCNGIMYTLRRKTFLKDGSTSECSHVKNLSTDKGKAELMALGYIEKFKKVINNRFLVTFEGFTIGSLSFLEWGDGKLSSSDIYKIKTLMNGVMPFGKHSGKSVDKVPTDYLCWVCKTYQTNLEKNKVDKVAKVLANIALAELIDRDFIKNNDDLKEYLLEKSEEKRKVDILSKYVGEVKERLELSDVIIEYCKQEWNQAFNQMRYFFKLRKGHDILIYSGSTNLGDTNQKINIRATVKEHKNYDSEVKSTIICRPTIL